MKFWLHGLGRAPFENSFDLPFHAFKQGGHQLQTLSSAQVLSLCFTSYLLCSRKPRHASFFQNPVALMMMVTMMNSNRKQKRQQQQQQQQQQQHQQYQQQQQHHHPRPSLITSATCYLLAAQATLCYWSIPRSLPPALAPPPPLLLLQ